MNVLWLDDSPERTRLFRSFAPYATVTSTASECIEVLEAAEEPWDIVFLDHDLGGEVYVDPAHPNTGSEVVRWMAVNKPDVKKVVVHSCNSVAAQYMTEDLAKVGYEVQRMAITSLVYEKVGDKNLLEVILDAG